MSRVLYVACAHIEEGSMVGLEVAIFGVFKILVLSDLTRKLNISFFYALSSCLLS